MDLYDSLSNIFCLKVKAPVMSKAECGKFVIFSCSLERTEKWKGPPQPARELCHSPMEPHRGGVDLDRPMNDNLITERADWCEECLGEFCRW